MSIDSDKEPKLVYPRQWTYAVIGLSEADLRVVVGEVLVERAHEVEFANVSANGKYISLRVTTLVQSEEDRNIVFKAFHDHPATKLVI